MDTQNYLLEIELLECYSKVMREFVVPSDICLNCLHGVIQFVMGWKDRHMHEFCTAFGNFGEFDPDYYDETTRDERDKRLSDIVNLKNPTFEYIYDFGGDWTHLVKVKSFHYEKPLKNIPICLSALGACPPEDVGGPGGYDDFCIAVNDPKNPRYKEMCDWVYEFCGYPKSQKWPDGVSVSKINKHLNEYDFTENSKTEPEFEIVPPLVQKEHFVEILTTLGNIVLESSEIPQNLHKSLWQTLSSLAIMAWNASLTYDKPAQVNKMIKKMLKITKVPDADKVFYLMKYVAKARMSDYPDDHLMIKDVKLNFKQNKRSMDVIFLPAPDYLDDYDDFMDAELDKLIQTSLNNKESQEKTPPEKKRKQGKK